MRTAILGWGSLLWEGGSDFDEWHDPWHDDGPTLRLEFSRVSSRRLGALTLVIDEQHGRATTVAWCLSKRTDLEDALCDLRCREGTTVSNISRVVVPRENFSNIGGGDDPIVAWARVKELDAVVWTALKSNFQEKTKQLFSIEAAMSYVKGLSPAAKVKAAEYVWRAPNFVKTPLRSALQTQPWFSEVSNREVR